MKRKAHRVDKTGDETNSIRYIPAYKIAADIFSKSFRVEIGNIKKISD